MANIVSDRQPVSEVDVAYAAGIIDGEGTIGITELLPNDRVRPNGTRVRKSVQHRIYVAVSMTDPTVPMWLHATFGGNIQYVPSRNPARHKPSTRWSMSSERAAVFCTTVMPYLRVKRQQAGLAVEFYRKHLGRTFQGSSGVPVSEVAARHSFVERINDLNRRGA